MKFMSKRNKIALLKFNNLLLDINMQNDIRGFQDHLVINKSIYEKSSDFKTIYLRIKCIELFEK